MQLGIGKTVFPAWAASVTLVKEHGTEAVQHATAAIKAGDGATRLDSAVRAMTSFDHAVDNTRKLPVSWFVKSAPLYYRGYEAAKQAVLLLVGSGLIPNAKQRVGRQTLLAASDAFQAGVEIARSNSTRFGGRLAAGWLEATAEDALTGVAMLQQGDLGRSLLAGIAQVRGAVERRRPLDERLVTDVTKLFAAANGALLASVDGDVAPVRGAISGDAAFRQAGVLLAQVEAAARQMVAEAPAVTA